MQLMIQMHLESDAIFGNGMSIPGGEDIDVRTDAHGFPYMKGSTLKGLFRKELINYLNWEQKSLEEIKETVQRLAGERGNDDIYNPRKLIFSDLTFHPDLQESVLAEDISRQELQNIFTYLRTFTGLEDGLAKDGSLRMARCIKKGLNFYGTCCCDQKDEALVCSVLSMIKWAGSMRNRGFGKIEMKVGKADE